MKFAWGLSIWTAKRFVPPAVLLLAHIATGPIPSVLRSTRRTLQVVPRNLQKKTLHELASRVYLFWRNASGESRPQKRFGIRV
jgi:hypothetical protein